MNPMMFKKIINLDDNMDENGFTITLTILFSTLNFCTWHNTFIENDFRKNFLS